ncbi:ligase-associated DNA damage response endonuclease PdeM [Chelatococcus reniformis]|uniref:Metallophosphatase n=1 Tax=Chelatococcus reniformis TaxID=1494448 RepID=A0A916UQW5_9HYPH|nr:ligase-associated DNA damage response endonuclease PdeM [Chelatococcus reniformis]GGC83448.1 metallophosphatase [Chelatococcus reniformis]
MNVDVARSLRPVALPPPGEAVVALGDAAFLADPVGALFEPGERLLVVADLHLEKGSSYAERGVLLPPYDTRATLSALGALVARYAPRTVLALGDSFHDVGAGARLNGADRAMLTGLQAGRDWIWVTGNHDPQIPQALGGTVVASLVHRGIVFRHEPGGGEANEMAGHLHPVAKVRMRGRSVRRRCFAVGPGRCILPAFGAYAGGLNVRDPAFRPLFPAGMVARVLGTQRIFTIADTMLLPD